MSSVDKIYHDNICAICYEEYKNDEANECLLLKCGHIFHESCVKTWINQQHRCPSCKSMAFVPVLFKDIAKETVAKGIEGAKKVTYCVSLLTCFVATQVFTSYTTKYFFPKWWDKRFRGDQAYLEEHGIEPVFDLDKSGDRIKLGGFVVYLLSFVSTCYMLKSILERRNRPVEVATAKQIKYIAQGQ